MTPAALIGAALDLLCELEAGLSRTHDNASSRATETAPEQS